MARNTWSEQESMAAFALYWLLPQKDYRDSCPEIAELARGIGRTANAVKMKIENLKRGDPNRAALGQAGLPNGAKLELELWRAYLEQGEPFLERCTRALDAFSADAGRLAEARLAEVEMPPLGEERAATRVERVNQGYFRNSLLANYQQRCCLTGISEPRLLVASHIKPWAVADSSERTAASNGLLLNALHDRAFDRGLITLNKNLEVVVSSKLPIDEANREWIARLAGQKARLPLAMPPAKEFLEYHNDVIFVA